MESARWPIDTPGGRFYAEWDSQAPVSREGQLMFFFQFLDAGDRWKSFLADCPLHYFGNRGSFTRDDGTPLNYTLVNLNDWCKNTFEVANQLRINTDYSHRAYAWGIWKMQGLSIGTLS